MLSILITHYNRPDALSQCIDAIRLVNWKMEYEIIVSDDGSLQEHIETIKKHSGIKFVFAKNNQGLAANINKGLKACKGDYILYCQEDFLILGDIEKIIEELYSLLANGPLEMIRLRFNYRFPYLLSVSKNVNEIPKFSWRNFYYNAFQYSDNTFLTTPAFFTKNQYYLEETSGDYGETEYAIRIFKSTTIIGITKRPYTQDAIGSVSVTRQTLKNKKPKLIKEFKRFLRSIRLHVEYVFYNPNKRGLMTYRNKRKKS